MAVAAFVLKARPKWTAVTATCHRRLDHETQ
jgi:hypothetical protein